MGNINNAKTIRHPIPSIEIAEFAGIILGDGGISEYQITVTLNDKTDREYTDFVVTLGSSLFGISPAVYHRPSRSVQSIVFSSRAMVLFCEEVFQFKIGNKISQRIDMPDWIKKDQDFATSCFRGMFDTDGSVVLHRYKVSGKLYCYKKLEYCSISPPLRISAYESLLKLGMHPRIARSKSV